MTLKDLARVLPAYITVYVHDNGGKFAYRGNPHEFVLGLYKSIGENTITFVSPLDFYRLEITVEDEK